MKGRGITGERESETVGPLYGPDSIGCWSTEFHGQWSNDCRIATLHTFSVLGGLTYYSRPPTHQTCSVFNGADEIETLCNNYVPSLL